MDKENLPFEVGQLAESRSFLVGYRGAWFRSKIQEITSRKKEKWHALEFYDFPDEKLRWTKLYQKPPSGSKSKEIKRQLMVRPSFPPVYRESEKPDVNKIFEVIVIVNDAWKVGDLVDWWTDGCYWSGSITEMLGAAKVRIELLPPPVGEGSSYEVFCKDLRPSLDWCPKDGWTLPIPEEQKNYQCCARLIKPGNQVGSQNMNVDAVNGVKKDDQTTAGASLEHNGSFSSRISASSLPPLDRSERHAKRSLSPTACKEETHTPESNTSFVVVDTGIEKSSSDSVSSSHVRDTTGTADQEDSDEKSGPLKKMRCDGSIPINSMCSDTIEAAILDLEELVNRVKWIKGILQMRAPNTQRPLWKFLDHRSSSLPK